MLRFVAVRATVTTPPPALPPGESHGFETAFVIPLLLGLDPSGERGRTRGGLKRVGGDPFTEGPGPGKHDAVT